MSTINDEGAWHPEIRRYIMVASISGHCVPMFGLKV